LKLFRKRDYITFGFILLYSTIAIVVFTYIIQPEVTALPKIQPCDVDSKLVDSSIAHICKYHKIPDFKLTNQNGKEITAKDYENKIYIADFFFTTCPGICPIMTENMNLLQKEFKNDNEIKLLSHTVNPEIDSVEQLKRYAIEKKVNDEKWNLVTGSRKQIYDLARKSYLVGMDSKFGLDAIMHTQNFVLVDKEKNIRGIYDGTSSMSIDSLINDIKFLKKEYNKEN
tara:strand:- start:77809 stop:78489 length:681 start_codon:yes stop_codon:yes gene_type:complete